MDDEIRPVTGETHRRPSTRWAGQVNVRLDATTLADLRRLTRQVAWPDNSPSAVIRRLIREEAARRQEEK